MTLPNSLQPLGRGRILVVDDQPVNIRALYGLLRDEHDVFMATSGEQALELCQQQQPDLILLDVIMPGMNGHEVCRQLKANPATAAIPVIFITGQNDEKDEVLGLELGAADFISKPFNPVVVQARVKIQLTQKFQADLLRATALKDELTGVANRRKFEEELQLHWRQCMRVKVPLSLILIDVDHFKKYNDFYGHVLGDVCLRKVGQTLHQVLNRPFDSLSRYGGEEFVCLLPQTDADGALTVARAMLASVLEQRIEHAAVGEGQIVTISLGVATLIPTPNMDLQALIQAADEQLYEAKRAGRARVGYSAAA